LTGKYPTRVGINRATPEVNLALDEATIAEALKEAGYRTAHIANGICKRTRPGARVTIRRHRDST